MYAPGWTAFVLISEKSVRSTGGQQMALFCLHYNSTAIFGVIYTLFGQ